MRNIAWMVLAAALLSTGCIAGGRTDDATATSASAVEQQQMMNRWNAAVDSTPSDFTQGTGFDFYWTTFRQFPHPTFKGGSEEAYQTFAAILLTFMQNDDNFQYLAEQRLFDVVLGYDLPSGQSDNWGSLRELVDMFSSDTMFGNIPESTRSGLEQVAARIAQGG